ncbi:formylglycine-generating enzyme family protein [Azospirillum rugosum]|uniref:Sulfatase-modifying factor enzyme-like domain-containing protein n=1 Tax=Azospirillum rugosum TaxID=416170 RepID=A0ABS4SV46_9PROT|nr:SUMF1/EgtB/PvdO family nonheme iron enzyme [Azospirillum rugosum]MBP2295255.1 hypothetical protein [Azospirillum rugosum]MDQ0528629.1 hypothetical protein [Azospirillum rugosum]
MSERSRGAIRNSLAALASTALLLAAGALRAEPSPWQEDAYNPVKMEDDLVLPLPCGGAMAFRPVAVIGGRPFDDQPVSLGSADETIGYLGGPRVDHVGAPFPDPKNPERRLYYIGKYEVSAAQLAALGPTCPTIDPASLLPATNISWFDTVTAANRYSEWLAGTARAALPTAEGTPAFVRLPTEAEWEYAARGGLAVDQAAFAGVRFRMPADNGAEGGSLSDYVWHQGSGSANGTLHPIGSLKPNPLGIFDILGNAAEMMLEPFRLNRRGREHGQAGGIVVRGGDFTMPAEQQRIAWRQELPAYDPETGAATRGPRYGFRLMLSAPTVATVWPLERVDELTKAWQQLPADDDGDQADKREKRAMDDIALAALTTESAALRDRLREALVEMENGRAERNDARDRLVRSLIRNGAISAERVQIEDLRTRTQEFALDKARALHKQARDNFAAVEQSGTPAQIEEARSELATIVRQFEARSGAAKAARAELDVALVRYGDVVIELSKEYGIDLLRQQGNLLKAELQVRGHTELIAGVDLLVHHAEDFQRTGPRKPDDWRNDIVNSLSSRR